MLNSKDFRDFVLSNLTQLMNLPMSRFSSSIKIILISVALNSIYRLELSWKLCRCGTTTGGNYMLLFTMMMSLGLMTRFR